ncbi:MAG: chromate transporter [Bryobacter sp.]|nr:chromate transporter [Bryobacter sp.]
MKVLLLYWIFTQATLSSFTGLSTLPLIRHELVSQRHWITDEDLNAAVLVGRSTPGPMSVYLVSIGQQVLGWPGAVAAWLSLVMPAGLILLLAGGLRPYAQHQRFKNAIRFIVLASNGYALATLVQLCQAAFTHWLLALLSVCSAALLLRTRLDTLWILLGAGAFWLLVSRLLLL